MIMKKIIMLVLAFSMLMFVGCTGTVNTVIAPNIDLKKYGTIT